MLGLGRQRRPRVDHRQDGDPCRRTMPQGPVILPLTRKPRDRPDGRIQRRQEHSGQPADRLRPPADAGDRHAPAAGLDLVWRRTTPYTRGARWQPYDPVDLSRSGAKCRWHDTLMHPHVLNNDILLHCDLIDMPGISDPTWPPKSGSGWLHRRRRRLVVQPRDSGLAAERGRGLGLGARASSRAQPAVADADRQAGIRTRPRPGDQAGAARDRRAVRRVPADLADRGDRRRRGLRGMGRQRRGCVHDRAVRDHPPSDRRRRGRAWRSRTCHRSCQTHRTTQRLAKALLPSLSSVFR